MTTIIVRVLFLIAIFLAVFLAAQVGARYLASRRSHSSAINRRMELIESGVTREVISSQLLKNNPRKHGELPPFVRGFVEKLEQAAFASAIPLTLPQILLLMAAASAAAFLIVIVIAIATGASIGFGVIQLAFLFSVALGVLLPYLIIQRIAASRRKKMEKQFPVALDIFVRALRSGHPIASAIDLLTHEMEDPIGSEFGIVSDEVTYGSDLTSALAAMADRWQLDDMRMFVVSLAVQSETGGNLAEILENLSTVIRERASMFMKVRALSSEGRMTGWMLTVLPVFAFVTVFLGNPSFYLNVTGDIIFIVGSIVLTLLYIIGVIVIRKMVDIKV